MSDDTPKAAPSNGAYILAFLGGFFGAILVIGALVRLI
jgi:hypothetical protein